MIGRRQRRARGAAAANRARAEALYDRVVAQARQPVFYAALGVPDTVDGRFELLALHMALVLMRLKDQGEEARELSQALFDRMFADMDRNLRDMGVGDLKVGKHVRRMAEALYGRLRAYERGLAAAQDDALAEALRRNLFGTVTGDADPPRNCLADLTTYMRRAAAALDRQPVVEILSGAVAFGPPPGGDGQA